MTPEEAAPKAGLERVKVANRVPLAAESAVVGCVPV
jgi:hypothetical protein